MELSVLLGIIASIIDIGVFILYNKDILQGRCRPKIVSWGLWAFLAVLACTSYISMTGDWVKCILSVISTTACVVTFIFSLFKGEINKLGKLDYWILTLGIFAALVWWIYKNSTLGNLLLQPCFIIAHIPTWKSVWGNNKNEKSLPWLLWTATFAVQIIIVLLRWKGQYQDIVSPISGFITCASVPMLMFKKTKSPSSILR